jgi:hypothetical protein
MMVHTSDAEGELPCLIDFNAAEGVGQATNGLAKRGCMDAWNWTGANADTETPVDRDCCRELELAQTAAAMELSAGTVKSRLNAALNKLRSVLK